MAKVLKQDELNNLLTEYFDIMDISKEQKLERIELAEELFDVFLFLLTYIEAQISASVSVELDKNTIYEIFERRYAEACEEYGIKFSEHPEIRSHITAVSKSIVDTTLDNGNNKQTTKKNANNKISNSSTNKNTDKKDNSEGKTTEEDIKDRALLVAENETNSIMNRVEYDVAKSSGKYTHKTWLTELDNKVRKTHRDIDSLTIPIGEYFSVGNSKMMFPRDTSGEAEAKEIVNCRCSVRYS